MNRPTPATTHENAAVVAAPNRAIAGHLGRKGAHAQKRAHAQMAPHSIACVSWTLIKMAVLPLMRFPSRAARCLAGCWNVSMLTTTIRSQAKNSTRPAPP